MMNILIIDDDALFGEDLEMQISFVLDDAKIDTCISFDDVNSEIDYDVIVCDHDLHDAGSVTGADYLKSIRAEDEEVELILLTGQGGLGVKFSIRGKEITYIEKGPNAVSHVIEHIRELSL
jgi:DNA-binding NtrC family response regulator